MVTQAVGKHDASGRPIRRWLLGIHEDQELLEHYNFRVLVDGIQLFKPAFLQGNPNGYTWQKIPPVTKTVYGKTLRFHGYIVVQEALNLHPDELRGILVRVSLSVATRVGAQWMIQKTDV